jgi:integrase
MPKRRGNSEGSIYKTKDGRWRGEISLGYTAEGTPIRKIIYGKDQAEVISEFARLGKKRSSGQKVQRSKQTVADFLTAWLEDSVKLTNRAGTYRSYEWIVRVHLIPGLGKLTLEKLNPQVLQAFTTGRSKAGLSPATVKHINATLRAALSQAEEWELVDRNVAKLVKLPRAQKYKPTFLSPEQAKAFLLFTADHPQEALFSVALSLGLRRGEIVGLRWQDIDFAAGMLRVTHSLERIKGSGLQLGDPKSAKAQRLLRLPQVCILALARQKENQRIAREWCGAKWKEGDFVFTTSVGTPMQPEMVTREFKAIIAASGLPDMRLHDLRHSCATLLLAQGVHPKLVQETLGHSTYQLTMDTYSHMIPQLRNEVADRMDEILSPTKLPPKTPEVRLQ